MRMAMAWVLLGTLLALALQPVAAQTTQYPFQKRELPDFIYFYWEPNTNVGWQFKCAKAGMMVTEFGCITYDKNPRVVTLFDCTTQQVIAQQTTPAAQSYWSWRWVTLSKPVILKKDHIYSITQFTGTSEYYVEVNLNADAYWRPMQDVEFIKSVHSPLGTSTPNSFPGGLLGTSYIDGIPDFGYQIVPAVEVVANPGDAQVVYPADQGPGGNGRVAGRFSLLSVGQPATATMESITIEASGSANDALDVSEVSLYRDLNGSGALELEVDVKIGQPVSSFSTDNGTATFYFQPGQDTFNAGDLRKYLVVTRLIGTAEFNETIQFKVSALTPAAGSGSVGAPSVLMEGLVITHQPFELYDNSGPQRPGYAREIEYVLQDLTVRLPYGPVRQISELTFTASGTGDDQNDFVSVALYRDANLNGLYDTAADALVGAHPGFFHDNGYLTFGFDSSAPVFAPGDSQRFFLVVKLKFSAPDAATYRSQLTGATERFADIGFTPLPCPEAGPVGGLVAINRNLLANLVGPTSSEAVANNSMGPNRKGHVLCDVAVRCHGMDWQISHLHFRASGSGDDASAFASLMLLEDYNGSGAYEGLPQDIVATVGQPAQAFDEDNGLYKAPLANPWFEAGTTRRFFLVVMFFGNARTGDSFNAALEGYTGTPPTDGYFAPSEPSQGPVIDLATVMVGLGSGSPLDTSVESGLDFAHVIAKFRFSASGAPASLQGLQLTNLGIAEFNTDLRGGDGVELWLDDGNGLFDSAVDIRLCAVTGFNPVTPCQFETPVEISNGVTRDIWVRLNVLASAGGSVPDTFQVTIKAIADVNAGGANVVFGAMPPVSNTLSVVVFAVDELAPRMSVAEGGAPITLRGTGFTLPLKLYIGGVQCYGTPVVSVDGRQVTGLFVPPGQGRNLPVTVKSGGLAVQTLPMAFSYNGGAVITNFDHTSTCAAAPASAPALLLLPLLMLGILVWRGRRA